jgi:putative membrane protein
MKKILNFSKIILATGLVLCTLNSCKKEEALENQTESLQQPDNEVTEVIENDADFLADAAELNIMQIEIGKLAQKKGISPEIRNYGKMLVDDHTKSMEELKQLANKNTITLPSESTDMDDAVFVELNEKSGADFDKTFAEIMADDHEKAMDKMTEISQKASDNDIKIWASRQVIALTTHFEAAKKIKGNMAM